MNRLNRCQPLLGTYVEISLSGDCSDDELIAVSRSAYAEIELVQRNMSFHDPESELSQINRNAHLKPIELTHSMSHVLTQALSLSELTQGDYDICVGAQLVKTGQLPSHNFTDSSGNWCDIELNENVIFFQQPLQLDLGGIAKGYAVDRAISVIPEYVDATINAGGDLRMSHWRDKKIHIRAPNLLLNQIVPLAMTNEACATSANYYTEAEGQTSKIIHPANGKPTTQRYSATVFADCTMIADALTKVVFTHNEASELLHSFQAKAVIVEPNGNYYQLT